MKEVLYRYNPWWETAGTMPGQLMAGIIERPQALELMQKNLASRQIIFLTGLRRVGKTTLLKLFIKRLLENKIAPKNILYVSLDDYLLAKNSILDILAEYRKLHKLNFQEKIYLFLDEVAYKEDFELQLKNLQDSQNLKIYASSSSASILRSKKPYLTGRNQVLEILPLDFQEYLDFKNINIKQEDNGLLESYFEDYFERVLKHINKKRKT